MKGYQLVVALFVSFFLSLVICESDAGTGKAFYILFANDINNSSFPAGFKDYELFVASPQNVTRAMIDRVHREIPRSKIVLYWDFMHIPIHSGCSTGHVMGDRPGRNCSTSYACGPGEWTTEISRVFPPRYAINKLFTNGSKEVICGYPGLASYVPFLASARVMVDLLSGWVDRMGFDGVYLDGTIRLTEYETIANRLLSNVSFDCNGDGKSDSIQDLLIQYQSWYPYFIHSLRLRLGEHKIIIGNSAGALSNPDLNGLTIEMENCVSMEECDDAVLGQYYVSSQPAMGIIWLTHSEVIPPAEQCKRVAAFQRKFPWLLAGTDFFDGSHVVCNNPN